ncbi:4Fe-4S binding protein [Methanoregula sp.]|uniref:4Fe-4S binding protein n=1 Tax=Methanoregula sp. TaxID=2052170 RepID=UPI000CCACC7C|nr:4Fe-4S binding protein [Methanoregula sp.]PKG33602.1 MAG: epoxyqueuosine reductase [Methanoregula sp.]
MAGDDLKKEIRQKCTALDIPLVGFAPADRWDTPLFDPWIPLEFRPRAICPEAKTVIVFGLPVSLPIVDSAPSIWYRELYKTVNSLLDQGGYRIALFLSSRGFPSVWIPRDGYGSLEILKEKPVAFFSHRHAAFLAGLGNFGVNNVLLTPEFGPRVRFASVFTAAEIPPDAVMEEPLCTRCMRCVDACPVHALPGQEYPLGLTDKLTCTARSEALNKRALSPCGICIKVCPVGRDRTVYGREDCSIYDEENPDAASLHRSWKHVRSYGSR